MNIIYLLLKITSTAVYSNNSVSLSGQDNSPLSLTFNNDGTKMFVLGTQNDLFMNIHCQSVLIYHQA